MKTAAIYEFSTKKQVTEKSFTFADCLLAMDHAVAPNYQCGCVSGNAAALAYLKYMASDNYSQVQGLQHVFFKLARQLEEATSDPENDAIRGRIVGMFSLLDLWLRFAVKNATSDSLSNATWQTIQASLQDASEGGPLKRFEEKQRAIRSEQARQAAKSRWSKRKPVKE